MAIQVLKRFELWYHFVYSALVSGIQFKLYFLVLKSSIKVWFYHQLSLDIVPIYANIFCEFIENFILRKIFSKLSSVNCEWGAKTHCFIKGPRWRSSKWSDGMIGSMTEFYFFKCTSIYFIYVIKFNINIPIRMKETLWGQFEMTFVKRQGHMKV